MKIFFKREVAFQVHSIPKTDLHHAILLSDLQSESDFGIIQGTSAKSYLQEHDIYKK